MTFEITCKNSGRASYGEHVSFGRELLKEPDNVDVSISSRTDELVGRIRQFQVGKRYEVTVSQVGLMTLLSHRTSNQGGLDLPILVE